MSQETLQFVVADDEEVNTLAAGNLAGEVNSWGKGRTPRFQSGQMGVLIEQFGESADPRYRPVAMVVSSENQGRLFGRFATLRNDLSPISSWCHVFDNELFRSLEDVTTVPDLGGLEASWSGLAIAEAQLLAGRGADRLKIAACLATTSFAVARSFALWPRIALNEVLTCYEQSNLLIRGEAHSGVDLAKRLEPIWRALIEASKNRSIADHPTAKAISALNQARLHNTPSELNAIAIALRAWPESDVLKDIENAPPEDRVVIFDTVLSTDPSTQPGREVVSFIAGYISTIAAGGLPSLGLAERVSSKWPEVLAWAHVIGGIGEKITWTSSFHGLGRLVWREVSRPFHVNETPNCDFSFEESAYLVDLDLSDPLVHLKIKQQRLVTVALFPGVNIVIPLPESQDASSVSRPTPTGRSRELAQLADDIWPHIERKIISLVNSGEVRHEKSITKGKKSQQTKFSFNKKW